MRIYVAGRFQSYEKVRRVIDHLKQHGHEITYDWTRTAEFGPDGHPIAANAHDLPVATLRSYARRDLHGVSTADFVVVCADDSLCGGWIEVGYALASPQVRRIFVIATERWSIFLELQKVRQVPSYEEWFRLIESLAPMEVTHAPE